MGFMGDLGWEVRKQLIQRMDGFGRGKSMVGGTSNFERGL